MKKLMLKKSAALGLALALAAVAAAQGAPYYKWRSNLNGRIECQQVMHGEWKKVDGPFRDSRCTQRM